jgi:anti-sigma-K factor RskA
MSAHDHIRELIAPVALGAATEVEEAEVERHAATCHECRAELEALRGAATGLALEVPQMDPPPQLKARVMDAVRADARARAVVAKAPAPRRRLSLWPATAGALAVLAVGLVAWNVSLQSDTGAEAAPISFVGTADPTIRGTVVIGDDGVAVMRVTGLPLPAAGVSYELWTIRNGVPRSEGFAAMTPTGEAVVATAAIGDATALAITPEVRTNTAAPTVDPIIVVPLA